MTFQSCQMQMKALLYFKRDIHSVVVVVVVVELQVECIYISHFVRVG